jgi:hypothetical protein
MTYEHLSCIVVNAHLTDADKTRGRDVLRTHLMQTTIGISGTVLWHPDDELNNNAG